MSALKKFVFYIQFLLFIVLLRKYGYKDTLHKHREINIEKQKYDMSSLSIKKL